MSSLIVCRILASNYQANNHYNRAGAKCPIFLVMVSKSRFKQKYMIVASCMVFTKLQCILPILILDYKP